MRPRRTGGSEVGSSQPSSEDGDEQEAQRDERDADQDMLGMFENGDEQAVGKGQIACPLKTWRPTLFQAI